MTLRQIADAIGIGEYQPFLDEIYENMTFTDEPAVDLSLIDRLQEEWNLFNDYYQLVRAVGFQINGDELRSKWVKVTATHALATPLVEAKQVPAPAFDGTVVTNLLPLYTMLPVIPVGMQDYLDRGFTREEVTRLVRGYYDGMSIVHHRTGMPGVDKTYYNWLMTFAKSRIFRTEGLQFEMRKAPDQVVYLKNKQTGQVVPVMCSGMIHRSGRQILGSAGYEDAEGAFEGVFREDAQAFYGHGCFDGVIDTEEKAFPKAEWEVFLAPGGDCISIHIPRGTDISPAALDESLEEGCRIAAQRYPEHNGHAIYGSSWILDPGLEEMVGSHSNITRLQNRFVKYPQKSDGTSVFSFVFDGKPEKLEDLEETTSLHRKLKKLYLDGGYNHIYAGIIVNEG
ncbi:MAG: hypothetical protein J6A74_06965 [Oscillospiraceae bacterium]|nr:hypothetical protein [Oscillospiraceae bacterium]